MWTYFIKVISPRRPVIQLSYSRSKLINFAVLVAFFVAPTAMGIAGFGAIGSIPLADARVIELVPQLLLERLAVKLGALFKTREISPTIDFDKSFVLGVHTRENIFSISSSEMPKSLR